MGKGGGGAEVGSAGYCECVRLSEWVRLCAFVWVRGRGDEEEEDEEDELIGRLVTSHSGTHPSCQMMNFAAAMTMMLTGSISEQEPAFQLHQPQPQPRHLLLLLMLPLAPPPAQTLVSQISQTCPPWQSTHELFFKCDYVPTSPPTVLEFLLISAGPSHPPGPPVPDWAHNFFCFFDLSHRWAWMFSRVLMFCCMCRR